MAILSLQNVSFAYPNTDRPILNGLSLEIKEGDFVLLCGESGCGKSTLLRLCKPQISPNGRLDGQLFFNGSPFSQVDEFTTASEIGFVFQNPDAQIVTDKVSTELAFGLENLGLSQEEILRRVAEICAFFGMGDWYRRDTDTLSGGQKQILNLACVLAMQPRLLLLDEPTAQLDPIAAVEFLSALHKINTELGVTVILAEHRLEELFPSADQVLLMQDGKIALAGTPKEVGASLRELGAHPMKGALPCAVRFFDGIGCGEECPITLREGKEFLCTHFENRYDRYEVLPEPEQPKALELSGGYFRYERNGRDILRDLSLTVFQGEMLCILGANGVGKTTLLHVLCGIHPLLRGKLRVFEKDPSNTKKGGHARIGCLVQNPQTLLIRDALRDDLLDATKSLGLSEEESADRIENLACELGISHLLDAHPLDLSGGETQRAALAKLLLLEPRLLLLDEPTKGLDAHAKAELASLLARLQADGVTVVMVTHDIEFAAEYADRCAMFFDGQIISASNPIDFFSQNSFYTTAASRMSRPHYRNAVTVDQILALCRQNGRKED